MENGTGWMSETMRLKVGLAEMLKGGVIMDVAGAGGHLDFQVCRAALEKGFLPTTISTDMHDPAPGALVYGVHDLISQFHAMGLSLLEVVAASTVPSGRRTRSLLACDKTSTSTSQRCTPTSRFSRAAPVSPGNG